MSGKQILVVLLGVAAIYWGVAFFYEAHQPDAVDCVGEFRHPLPFCTTQDRLGSQLTIINECDDDVTLMWEYLGGNDKLHRLAPGEQKQMDSFPLKIKSVSCCSFDTSCF